MLRRPPVSTRTDTRFPHTTLFRSTDPACIGVIDSNRGRINAAEAVGCNVLAGDASSDETLVDVRISEAQSVLVSAGRDDTSILNVLTVRHLAPRVPISVVIRTQDNELLARQAGAHNVINPDRTSTRQNSS